MSLDTISENLLDNIIIALSILMYINTICTTGWMADNIDRITRQQDSNPPVFSYSTPRSGEYLSH